MTDAIDAWLKVHPHLGAFVFLMLALFTLLKFGEMSDGSRGGDVTGTGQRNKLAELLAFFFMVCALLSFFDLIS